MMQRPTLIFEDSPMFLMLCLLLGAAYAFFLYRKKGPWSPFANKVLFLLRSVTVATIAALLLSPILKQVQRVIEEPALVFAIDNSSSISEVEDSTKLAELNKTLRRMAGDLSSKYAIEYRSLSGDQQEIFPEKITYDKKSTNLQKFINDIRLDYEGRNLSGVVLVSDGIYNEGISPTFSAFNFDIYTLGVGDTVPKSDISIVSLFYNKISYQGNQFPMIAQITHSGYAGERATVSVFKGKKVLASERIKFGPDNQVQDVRFLIDANEKGYQRYQVVIEKKKNEFTYANNVHQAYVEIIEGKEQIALVAPAPHPDIKAIKAAVESNANYKVDQYILSLDQDVSRLTASNKKYDLIIYHQLPDRRSTGTRLLQKLEKQGTSAMIIYGAQTDLMKFNQFNKVLTVDAIPNEYDKVSAVFNQGFTRFRFSEELQQVMDEFPPIMVPFGEMSLTGDAEALLYQQVGNIATSKPLIAVTSEGDAKRGVVMGEGLWLWKLSDYAKNGNNEAFNELITKLVQYLSSKEDKRKFKAYPIKNEFLTNEKVVFNAEVYNDLYERVYGNKIDLTITDAEGNQSDYSYVTNEKNTRYKISGLPEGVYRYTASTILGNQKETITGEFLVKELQIEHLNLTADFDLLRDLSDKTGSEFFRADQLHELEETLTARAAQGTIHTGETYLPFIHLKWLFFLLLALLSAEWFTRKYNGAY